MKNLLNQILFLKDNEDEILKDLGLPIKSQWKNQDLKMDELSEVTGGVSVELISRDKILQDFNIEHPDYKPRTVIRGVPNYITKKQKN